jgi:uncharacterized membrane protein YbhN (UPF0104 family)
MKPTRRRVIEWGVGLSLLVLAVRLAWNFPWRASASAVLHADEKLLLLALVINLVSLVAKGWAWHLLLRPVAPHRWMAAQEANLVGAAVNNLAIAGVGEGARIHLMVDRAGLPVGPVSISVLWVRIIEGIGLSLGVLVAGLFLRLPPAIRGAQLAVSVAVLLTALSVWMGGGGRIRAWLSPWLRNLLRSVAEIGSIRRLPLPIFFALVNWVAQWLTYHLVLQATHIPVSFEASFTALLAANAGGLLRLTPANVGVMQASIAVALLPFGVPPERAIAASLVLQALQVLPVMALGAGLAMRYGLVSATVRSRIYALAHPPSSPGGKVQSES